jgi:hypothetical protein
MIKYYKCFSFTNTFLFCITNVLRANVINYTYILAC